jgi:integrase
MRGSIRQRSQNSWLLQIEGERVGNKRHRRFITVKGSKKDAQRKLTELLKALDDGTLPDACNVCLADYARHALDALAHAVSPKTLERYRELTELHIIPHLGAIKLQRLAPEHLSDWHRALLAGLHPRTVGHAHNVLSRMLRYAVENGTLARNVARVRKPPKVEDGETEDIAAR